MSTKRRLTVRPYTWTHDDGEVETGYRIQRAAGFIFLNETDAYQACCELADLIDAANNEAQQETDQ